MAESKYEKYVIRDVAPPNLSVQWARPGSGPPIVPSFFMIPGTPLSKEFNTMLEYSWITEDCAGGVTEDRGPHRHDCAEMFVFFGSNPEDPQDLGAEVEFWMGEGEETEKLVITTSSVIIAPPGVLHLPVFFRNVKRPILNVVFAVDIDDTLAHTERLSPRDL